MQRKISLCSVEARPAGASRQWALKRAVEISQVARFVRYAGLRPSVQSGGKGLVHF